MIQHYLKIALRNLQRHQAQSIISILGIAIGFTAFLLGGYWYYWENNFDTFHPRHTQTYAITTSGLLKGNGELNQLHESMEKEMTAFPEIKTICRVSEMSYRPDGKEKSWIGMRVDSLFFTIFQCNLIDGGYQGIPFDGRSVILTQKMAEYLFGNSSCVGKTVRMTKEVSFTVIGVMKEYPQNSNFKFDYLCLSTPVSNSQKRSTTYVQVYPHADIAALKQKITASRMKEDDTKWTTYSQWRFHLRSLSELHIVCSPELDARFRNIKILAAAGLLAFVSSLMNLLVLFVGQQQRKMRYTATFITLGASFRSLIGKSLLELALPLLAAFVLSMALIEFVFPFYQEYTQLMYESNSWYSGVVQRITPAEVIRFAWVAYPATSILFLFLSLLPIATLLKHKQNAHSQVLRNGLIAGQIFIGSLFLITSFSFYLQYRLMAKTDKGLVTDHIWQIDLGYDATYHTDCSPFITELKQSPFIEEVTALTQPLLLARPDFYCSYVSHLPIEGREVEETVEDNCMVVQKNFLSFFGMKMKEGEWITNRGTYDVVVNETGARELNIPALSGRPILVDSKETNRTPYRVSGIIADYHYCPMQHGVQKTFFVFQDNAQAAQDYMGFRYFYVKIRPEHTLQALSHVAAIYQKYDKDEVADEQRVVSLTELMNLFNRPEKTMFGIFLLLASLCILISSYGIYALVSLSAEQRRKEIAIRKVNGALFGHILQLFLKEYIWMALIGNAVALPLGYLFIRQWLDTYAYRTPFYGWLLPLVFLLTCSIVMLAVARQVWVAIRQSPVNAIKE